MFKLTIMIKGNNNDRATHLTLRLNHYFFSTCFFNSPNFTDDKFREILLISGLDERFSNVTEKERKR